MLLAESPSLFPQLLEGSYFSVAGRAFSMTSALTQ
jgi:hypothetical protein